MEEKVVVAVDAMGSDNAPSVEVEGAVAAARRWRIPIILVGDSTRIQEQLNKFQTEGLDIAIHHTSEVVGMHDSPSDAIRKKKDSSIRVAFELVREGKAHAVISAGNSGATMAAGMFILKRIQGIDRPAIATSLPNRNGRTMILDAGGNVDCKPHHLAQFALMGAVFARNLMDKPHPKVGLLSNGAEESKGNELTREAHLLLKGSLLEYIGYVEGRDIFSGSVDVVVCDGFAGNVVLKVSESLAEFITDMLRNEISTRLMGRIGYLLAAPAFSALKKKIDYSEVGGAPLLGIDGTGMICHGGSNPKAVMNAIFTAREFVAKKVNEKMVVQLQQLPQKKEWKFDFKFPKSK